MDKETVTVELDVHEIYRSIQGEARFAGSPCTFVRLSGCPLRCKWCDTVHAFGKGTLLSVDAIVTSVEALGTLLVEITGGEPLAQSGSIALMRQLVNRGFRVMIETSGAIDIAPIPDAVHIIMDIKPPGSGEAHSNRYENLEHLKITDEIKFVVASESDFQWVLDITTKYRLTKICQVLISPAFGLVKPQSVVEWMLSTAEPFKLNMQWHKHIWHPRTRGV